VWEGGIRVPLIIRGPGIAANSWCHQRVVGYDFFPSFCRWAGVKVALPTVLDGGDITPLLSGGLDPVKRPREPMVFHFPHYQGDSPHSAILSGHMKLIHFYETGENQLFDLKTDIGETKNLAAAKPELATHLAKQLADYLSEVGAAMPKLNPNYDPAQEPAMKGGGKGGKGGKKGGKK
jgi:arylsulfatase A-like enzyme